MSMVKFAELFGCSGGRFSRYEYGLAKLPYELGDKICNDLQVSQKWLATGQGDREQEFYVPVPGELQLLIPGKVPFSQAYAEHLEERIETYYSARRKHDSNTKLTAAEHLALQQDISVEKNVCLYRINETFSRCSAEQQKEMIAGLWGWLDAFHERHPDTAKSGKLMKRR